MRFEVKAMRFKSLCVKKNKKKNLETKNLNHQKICPNYEIEYHGEFHLNQAKVSSIFHFSLTVRDGFP